MSDDAATIPNPGFRGSKAGRYGMGAAPRVVASSPNADMKRMLLIAGGLAAILGGFFAVSAIRGQHSTGVPVIAADQRPIRVKPENPGGMKIDAAENDIFSGGGDMANARLAAAAEAPDPKALRAGGAPPPPPSPPKAAAEAAAVVPPPPPAVVKQEAAVAPPLAKPTAPTPAPASAAAGKVLVQLAALGTEDGAHTEWQNLNHKYPDLLKGHTPVYTRTERDGQTFWRVRIGGFTDAAHAKTFCEQVRTKGGGCSVAEL